ncbi:MAG: hypothetical protein LBU53_07560 [Zoogloeaceae bacterium]|jgi:hypothetical protein|nr:hypothetical protein [Zoogloeaceae bacterium]
MDKGIKKLVSIEKLMETPLGEILEAMRATGANKTHMLFRSGNKVLGGIAFIRGAVAKPVLNGMNDALDEIEAQQSENKS